MQSNFTCALKAAFPVLILFLLLGFTAESLQNKKVCFSNVCINVEVADTDASRQKGLMFRKELPEDRGMLFIFESEDKQFFYMKNMNFSLDVLWLDAGKKIVGIKKNFQPAPAGVGSSKTIASQRPALYVLEVNSGFCDKYKVQAGEVLSF
jgi:hypothetical protein